MQSNKNQNGAVDNDSSSPCPSSVLLLQAECKERGFDLCVPIHTSWYNQLIEQQGHVERGTLTKLPEPAAGSITCSIGSGCSSAAAHCCNALLIGNTKSIWPKFLLWLKNKQNYKIMTNIDQKDDEADVWNQLLYNHPFDRFVAETITQIFQQQCSCSASYEFFWSNGKRTRVLNSGTRSATAPSATPMEEENAYHCCVQDDDSFLVSMQRVAQVTGQFWHDESVTKLCVHPQFGTWIAFRALVVFGDEETAATTNNTLSIPPPPPPPHCPCPVSAQDLSKAKQVMEYAIQMSAKGGGPSLGYTMTATDSSTIDLCSYLHSNTYTEDKDWSRCVSPQMRPWIELRDCISVGKQEHRYSDAQLLYHYTKNVDILRHELRKMDKDSDDENTS